MGLFIECKSTCRCRARHIWSGAAECSPAAAGARARRCRTALSAAGGARDRVDARLEDCAERTRPGFLGTRHRVDERSRAVQVVTPLAVSVDSLVFHIPKTDTKFVLPSP